MNTIQSSSSEQLIKILRARLLGAACVFALSFLSPLKTTAQTGLTDGWHWRSPVPNANSLRSICFGNGKFVSVGDGGVIHTSFDGVTWDDGRRPVTSILRKVVFADGLFIAVGHEGAIVTSSDGYSWTSQVSGTTNMLFSIVHENGHYVACGQAGRIVTSTNGADWTIGSVGTNDLKWIAGGNGVFILPLATPQLALQVSSNLQTWTQIYLPTGYFDGSQQYLLESQFGNGIFLAAGYEGISRTHFYSSTDGFNWDQKPLAAAFPSTFRFLNYANGLFNLFTTGGSTEMLLRTPDANSSTYSLLPIDMYEATGLAYGNGRYVMPGLTGKVWSSNNTTNWSTNYSGLRTSLHQLIRGASNYVMLAAGERVLISSDATVFTPTTNSPIDVLSSGAFDGSNFVAVGKSKTGVITFGGEVYTSTNSIDWVRRTSNANKPLNSICRGTTRWVAVGDDGIVTSSQNTLAWTLRSSGTVNKLNGVAFGNDLYVAVGSNGTIITSPDGAVWDVQFSGTTTNLNRVRFLNGNFIAVGAGGTILTSSDGATWVSKISNTTVTLSDVAFGDDCYVICGSDSVILNTPDPMVYEHSYETTFNVLLRSTNAVNWTNITTRLPAQGGLNSIAFLDDSFWLSGANGALLQSDSISRIPKIAGLALPDNAGFQIRITVNIPSSYRLQSSSNMATNSWIDIATVTNSSGQAVFVDVGASGSEKKFYRLASP